jgi:hypothetical protein
MYGQVLVLGIRMKLNGISITASIYTCKSARFLRMLDISQLLLSTLFAFFMNLSNILHFQVLKPRNQKKSFVKTKLTRLGLY